jgi:NADH:ubiquinone oxidoreductase subunit H
LREDQLQSLAWKWLVPLAILNIILTAFFKVAF